MIAVIEPSMQDIFTNTATRAREKKRVIMVVEQLIDPITNRLFGARGQYLYHMQFVTGGDRTAG
jgi:hypothetical protein